MTDNSAAIAQLQKVFGNTVDKDVLAAVLEVCGGDSKEAAKFLQAQGNEQAYDIRQLQANEGGIPQDYPGQKGSSVPKQNVSFEKKKSPAEEMKALFINENVTLQEHFDSQSKAYKLYTSVLLLLISQGVEISKGSRPRILAAAWARNDKLLTEILLEKEELFALPAVLGALNLLDAGRKVRAIEKKIARLEKQSTVKAKKLGQLKSTINDLKREAHIGSVSGALAKQIKKWVQKIPAEKLEFFALSLPKDPWKELADIVHLNPSDFQVKWFLEYAFGKDAPQDSLIATAANLTAENVTEVISKFQIPYSYLRVNVKPIPDDAKAVIASYAPIDTVVWYYEELATPQVDRVLQQRLEKEVLSFGYGKLMERLLYFKSINAPFFKKLMPIAEARLKHIDLKLESPVVVLGDASYSMDVAIRTATVIGSVLTALCNADLTFFNGEPVKPPIIPRTISQVLDVATGVKADGLTAAAAGLWPYYTQKKVVKFFILVTDEIDNEKYKGHYFPSLFLKYYKEVYPAKIVFVSFLENPSSKGRMVTALENMGIVPLQFKCDGKRPGLLASESSFFDKQVDSVSITLDHKGIKEAEKSLRLPEVITTTTSSSRSEGKDEEVEEKVPAHVQDVSKVLEKPSPEEKNDDSRLCVICEERNREVALLECGHASFCLQCAEPLVGKECPMCRSNVVRFIRIYQN